jgi:hypothetical protein
MRIESILGQDGTWTDPTRWINHVAADTRVSNLVEIGNLIHQKYCKLPPSSIQMVPSHRRRIAANLQIHQP